MRATKGERSTALSPEIEVPARTKISRCLRSYSCRRLQVLKFQHDSASDGSTLTISTLFPFEKKQDKPYKEDMNPKSLPLDLNSGGTSAAFAGADEIVLTVRQAAGLPWRPAPYKDEETRGLYVCRPLPSSSTLY